MKIDFCRMSSLLALRFGDHEALVNVERKRRYTFRELHRLTNRIANAMRSELGLRRGDVALSILDNDNLSLLHLWTTHKAEATSAWTNYRDSMDEHRWQVDWVQPKVVFLEAALVDRYSEWLRERSVTIVSMDPPPTPRPGVVNFWDLVERASDAETGVEHDARGDVTLLRFTGGTTGKGKCAAYVLDNWLGARDAFYAHPEPVWREGMRLLHFAPISHGSGLMVLPTYFRGGCTVTQNVPDLGQWCRNVEEEKITHSMMVPTLLYRLLDLEAARDHDLSTLETIFYGAAPMNAAKLRALAERFGNVFVQVYAATESVAPVTCLGKSDHVVRSEDDARRLGSAGRVTPGVEIRVVDDGGCDVAPGASGEIWLRSRSTIGGYHRNPEGTASEFTDGFWKSGDIGALDENGYLTIVDRKKDMIISGGFNVYASEVEAALGSHPAVQMSAVVGVPHAEWGEAVHAEVVLRSGHAATEDALIAHVKSRIGSYKAPKSITLVLDLPTSVVGKVLRRQVKEKYWKGRERGVG